MIQGDDLKRGSQLLELTALRTPGLGQADSGTLNVVGTQLRAT